MPSLFLHCLSKGILGGSRGKCVYFTMSLFNWKSVVVTILKLLSIWYSVLRNVGCNRRYIKNNRFL